MFTTIATTTATIAASSPADPAAPIQPRYRQHLTHTQVTGVGAERHPNIANRHFTSAPPAGAHRLHCHDHCHHNIATAAADRQRQHT